MNAKRHLTLVAAASALLAAMPLATIFARWTWLLYSVILVGVVCGIAVLMRSMRVPVWLPTVAMAGTAVLLLTWLFPSGKEFAGVIPTVDTVWNFNRLLLTASQEMRTYGIPVEDRPGFLFLATLGIGGVAVLIDLCAVVLRRPALAGLPMLAIYSVPVAVHQDSVSMWPFVLGAAGFLWLLVSDNVDKVRRFGRRFTGEGRDIDAWEPSPLAAAGQRLGLIGIALAVILPLTLPGMTGGLLDRFGSTGGGGGIGNGTGPGVGLYAMLSGNLRRDKTIAMVKVTTNDPNPYYLRFATADQLSPNGFTGHNPTQGRPTGEGVQEPKIGAGGTARTFQATVDVVDLDSRFLPVYLEPTKITNIDGGWLWDDTQSVVFSNRESSQKKKYTVEYNRVDYAPEVLERAKDLPASNSIQQHYTETPPSQDVTQRVAQLTAGKVTPYDKVRALFDYFSPANGFTYSLTTEPGNSGSQLIDFLTNKKGYCVQYSAALAWLVRAAGIPARVAFGFTKGNASSANATTTLTNFNLHAWTEVYFDGYGWLPFDATPATNILGSASPAYAPNPSRPSDAQAAQGDDTLTPASPNASSSAAAPGAAPGNTHPDTAGGPATPIVDSWSLWTPLGVLLGLVILAVPATRRVALRRRRLRFRPVVSAPVPPGPLGSAGDGPASSGAGADGTGSEGAASGGVGAGGAGAGGAGAGGAGAGGAGGAAPARDAGVAQPLVLVMDDPSQLAARLHAHAAWDELIDTMTDYRLSIDEAETPRGTVERLVGQAALADSAAEGARLLGRAEERARYSRSALGDGELRPSLAAVRTALAARASRRTRLRATVLPPSVLQRWRLTVLTNSSQAFNGASRVLESLVRALSVRRALAGRAGR